MDLCHTALLLFPPIDVSIFGASCSSFFLPPFFSMDVLVLAGKKGKKQFFEQLCFV